MNRRLGGPQRQSEKHEEEKILDLIGTRTRTVEDWRLLLTIRNTTIFLPLCHFLPRLIFSLDGGGMKGKMKRVNKDGYCVNSVIYLLPHGKLEIRVHAFRYICDQSINWYFATCQKAHSRSILSPTIAAPKPSWGWRTDSADPATSPQVSLAASVWIMDLFATRVKWQCRRKLQPCGRGYK
jgi:hypothetical protein